MALKKKKNPNKIAEPMSDKVLQVINTLCLVFLGILVAYPLYFVVIASFSDPDAVNMGKTMLWPKDPQFIGFKKLLLKKDFKWRGCPGYLYRHRAALQAAADGKERGRAHRGIAAEFSPCHS